jgi:hypothetical protein
MEAMMTEEDEAFNDIERQAKQRKESVKAAVQTLSEYERGFIDGMQKQMQSSVDKAVNAMSQRTWVGLTDREMMDAIHIDDTPMEMGRRIEAKLKEKNT